MKRKEKEQNRISTPSSSHFPLSPSQKKEHREFLELFHPQPGYKLLEVTTHADALTQLLIDFLIPYDGRLSLSLFPGEHQHFEASEHLKLHTVPDFAKPFRALPRDNDIVILHDVFHRHTSPERILKACYTTLANTGEVIITVPKGEMDIVKMYEDLEKSEYRAANQIDIFEEYDLVMAKKMHMWGNGL
ncbi:MAG: hypothetical protein U9Q62_12345 [Campylobacterota bacterium]|nr:hypothetical protein [Campylobacterota bacterium]